MHVPVLKKEILKVLDPKPNENFIDCTINGGGHAEVILERIAPKGKLLGIETDKEVFEKLKSKNWKRLTLINDSYTNLKKIVERSSFKPVNGILFDLGLSSWDLDESGRGFTFKKDEPLDMRYDASQKLTAEYIVNNYPYRELERIFKEYGEGRFAKIIAKKIIKERPLKSTFDLKKLIPRKAKLAVIFQALRIEVNDELNNIKKGLEQAEDVLEKEGRIGVISFHSLEDRIVKNFFKNNDSLKSLTKKPIIASKQEIKDNYRSKSAKFRGAVKK